MNPLNFAKPLAVFLMGLLAFEPELLAAPRGNSSRASSAARRTPSTGRANSAKGSGNKSAANRSKAVRSTYKGASKGNAANQPRRRPASATSKGNKKVINVTSGTAQTRSTAQGRQQFQSLARSSNPNLRAVGNVGLNGRSLNATQQANLNRSINNLARNGNLTPAQRSQLNAMVAIQGRNIAYNRLAYTNNYYNRYFNGYGLPWRAYRPWWWGPGWGYGLAALGGSAFAAWNGPGYGMDYPGFDPLYPAYEIPAAEDTAGSTVIQVLPGSANVQGSNSGNPRDRSYSTRFVRIVNAIQEPVTFHIRYHSPADDGTSGWFPPEKQTLDIPLEPGQVANVYDGPWRLNADQIRIWADTESGKNWNSFKAKPFNLVPEQSQDGRPGYMAPAADTVVFTITPKAISTERLPEPESAE